MMLAERTPWRVFEVNQGVFGPAKGRPRALWPKTIADFPEVPPVHLEVANKLSSSLLTGEPLCDELVAFVQHVFVEDEAGVVRHLGQFAGMSAADIAKAEHGPVEQIEPVLQR